MKSESVYLRRSSRRCEEKREKKGKDGPDGEDAPQQSVAELVEAKLRVDVREA